MVEAKQTTAKSNWQITKTLCHKAGYKKIKVLESNKMTDKNFWRIVDHRKNKNYIVVEKIVSVSDGTGYGWYSTKTKGTNYIIGYNKQVPKGKKVTSYVIYDPNSNEPDEILWVIDNRTYR
jgi:hypothetical protein